MPLNSTGSQGELAESLNLQLSSLNHAPDMSTRDTEQTGVYCILSTVYMFVPSTPARTLGGDPVLAHLTGRCYR